MKIQKFDENCKPYEIAVCSQSGREAAVYIIRLWTRARPTSHLTVRLHSVIHTDRVQPHSRVTDRAHKRSSETELTERARRQSSVLELTDRVSTKT